jgi:hypothetical protein
MVYESLPCDVVVAPAGCAVPDGGPVVTAGLLVVFEEQAVTPTNKTISGTAHGLTHG